MYYNYVYLDPRKPGKFEYETICFLYEPFYVGKGKNDRCYYHLKESARIDNNYFRSKLNFLKNQYNMIDYIAILNYTDIEDESYKLETNLISEIGSNLILDIKDGPLTNVCLFNQPPSLKNKTYKEIYGDKWLEQIEKRTALQNSKGGYFRDRTHTQESKDKISNSITGDKNPMWGKKHSAESIEKMRSIKIGKSSGKNNPNKKKFKVISPTGVEYFIEGELELFCTDNGISYSTLCKTLRSKKCCSKGKTKGWIVYYSE